MRNTSGLATGQANPARHRIDLSDDVALLSEDEVRPDYSRQVVADFFPRRKFNQLFRFTGVEILGYPFGLLAFNAELIQLIASPLKNKQAMPELLEVGEKFSVDRKCVGRSSPLFFGKEAFLWESSANCFELFALRKCCNVFEFEVGGLISILCDPEIHIKTSNISIKHPSSSCRRFLQHQLTSSSADLPSPFCCKSCTALCASACL